MSFETFQDLETPVPIFKTYIGNLLYSTPDLSDELASITSVVLGQIDIQDVISRDFSNLSIGKIKYQEYQSPSINRKCTRASTGLRLNILSPRQKCELGSNPKGLFVDTSGGRKVVTVANYTQRIIDDTHTAVIALADQIPLFAGCKRSLKASARSLSWLQQLRGNKDIDWNRTYLFGVTGSFAHNQYSSAPVSSISTTDSTIDDHIVANAIELLQQGCNGLVVGGAGMGESLYQLGIALRSVKHAAASTPCVVTPSSTEIVATSNDIEKAAAILPKLDTKEDEEVTVKMIEECEVERKKVLVMVQEMNSIREILLAVESGVDLIGTNFPQIISSSGLALTWNFNAKYKDGCTNSSQTENKISQDLADKVMKGTPSRKRSISNLTNDLLHSPLDDKLAGASLKVNSNLKSDHVHARTETTTAITTATLPAIPSTHEVINGVEKDQSNGNNCIVLEKKESNHATPDEYKNALISGGLINLWDGNSHRKNLQPILEGCHCHACKYHTRAYIHHLLTAKEMLGEILLYCHNQHQIAKLFEEIRCVKREGCEVFHEWSLNLISLMHDKRCP